jgi:hypothetical protein
MTFSRDVPELQKVGCRLTIRARPDEASDVSDGLAAYRIVPDREKFLPGKAVFRRKFNII